MKDEKMNHYVSVNFKLVITNKIVSSVSLYIW